VNSPQRHAIYGLQKESDEMRALSTLLLAGAVGLGGLLAVPATAQADGGWRGRNHYRPYVAPPPRVYGHGYGYTPRPYVAPPRAYGYGYGYAPRPFYVPPPRGFYGYGPPPVVYRPPPPAFYGGVPRSYGIPPGPGVGLWGR
jgi:hypothetical protein